MFILFTAIQILFSTPTIQASHYSSKVSNTQMDLHLLKCSRMKALDHNARLYYMKKIDFHRENAIRTYENARKKCMWLPKKTDRDLAKNCFTAAAASIAASTPQSKVVAMIITMLTSYGLDVIDEWNYINDQLYWSEYHWEMFEFYSNVLVKA